MRKYVKIIHEDLNAGGGSERLTITMMEALNEMGFNIDLETITVPDWNRIKKWYGNFSFKINQIKNNLVLFTLIINSFPGFLQVRSLDLSGYL